MARKFGVTLQIFRFANELLVNRSPSIPKPSIWWRIETDRPDGGRVASRTMAEQRSNQRVSFSDALRIFRRLFWKEANISRRCIVLHQLPCCYTIRHANLGWPNRKTEKRIDLQQELERISKFKSCRFSESGFASSTFRSALRSAFFRNANYKLCAPSLPKMTC